MFKHILAVALCLNLMLTAQLASACGNHFYLNPDQLGFIGGAAIRLAGLAPPEPVFKVKHPPIAKILLDTQSEITIEYNRPWRSRNVRMQLSSSSGVTLEEKDIELTDYDGQGTVHFSLERAGYNTISIKVVGAHKGEQVASSSVIYVQAKKPVNSGDMQVSAR